MVICCWRDLADKFLALCCYWPVCSEIPATILAVSILERGSAGPTDPPLIFSGKTAKAAASRRDRRSMTTNKRIPPDFLLIKQDYQVVTAKLYVVDHQAMVARETVGRRSGSAFHRLGRLQGGVAERALPTAVVGCALYFFRAAAVGAGSAGAPSAGDRWRGRQAAGQVAVRAKNMRRRDLRHRQSSTRRRPP